MKSEQKPEIVLEIERRFDRPVKYQLPDNCRDAINWVMAIDKDAGKCLFDDLGHLIGLNLAQTNINNARWESMLELIASQIPNLQALNLNENALTRLSLPDGMTALKVLDISENQLTEFALPAGMDHLREIRLNDNPLVSPPPDVVRQGMTEVLKWLKAAGKKPVLEAKVMFIGDSNFGKTHLIEMLKNRELKRQNITTTHGIERCRIKDASSEAGPVRLNVWDLGGQDFMRSTHQFFFTERTLYVLVTIARRERKELNHWLQLVHEIGGDAPVLIVINKTDLDDHDIDREALQRDYPNIVGFVRTAVYDSEKYGIKALETIDKLEQEIHRVVTDKSLMPSVFVEQRQEWFTVKNDLEKMEEKKIDYISYDEFRKLPHISTLPEEEQKSNLKQLASLGTVVSFVDDHRLLDTHVINPKWIMDGVYCLINDAEVKDARKGKFSYADLSRLLDHKKYPSDKYRFLVDLMVKFRLCYPVKHTQNTYLLPDLFSDIEPEGVWSANPDNMKFRLNYGNYPPDLFVTQFIVERYEDIVDEKRWRSGVVISGGSCQAIVRRSFKNEIIEIEVLGPSNLKRTYLHGILEVFRELHRPFSDKIAAREIPYKTVWLNYDHLLKYEEKHQPYYHPELEEEIPVSEILDGYSRPFLGIDKEQTAAFLENISKGVQEIRKGVKSIKGDTSKILKTQEEQQEYLETLLVFAQKNEKVVNDVFQNIDKENNDNQLLEKIDTLLGQQLEAYFSQIPSTEEIAKKWKEANAKTPSVADVKFKIKFKIPFIFGDIEWAGSELEVAVNPKTAFQKWRDAFREYAKGGKALTELLSDTR